MPHILVLEDDTLIATGLVYALEQVGYTVTHCPTIADASRVLSAQPIDLALLDMHLPDGTGFDIAAQLPHTPKIFLTVVDDDAHIERAFDDGAADYVTKPFRIRELLARIKRTLASGADGSVTNCLSLGEIQLDTVSGRVTRGGESLELTALEYRLLLVFATHRRQLLTRGQILEHVWDSTGNFVEDNTLSVYVKRLREKCGPSIAITTVRGVGYRVD